MPGSRMIVPSDLIGTRFVCRCGRTMWREPILKGPNAGAWRVVTEVGEMHRCGQRQPKRRPWTLEEEQFVEANVGYMSETEIAERLNRPVIGVYQIVSRINRRRRSRK